MIAALDVDYRDDAAVAAAVVFNDWPDAEPVAEYTARREGVQDYTPGEFFRRELPCLLAVLDKIQEPLHVILIDGYVSLGAKPGLGMHLSEALQGAVTIVGVAKTAFHTANAVEVTRGQSQAPLYVTAVGMDPAEGARKVSAMAGEFRIPALLKRVDQLARGTA